MPNWEPASYEIIDTKQNIENLSIEIEKAMAIKAKSDFDNWLGLLMLHIGWSYEEVCKSDNGCPNCRGWVVDRWTSPYFPDDSKMEYHMETESAWSPMDECIIKFVRHFCPDAVIYQTQVMEITEEL